MCMAKRARARSASCATGSERVRRKDDVEVAGAERGRGFVEGVTEGAQAGNEPAPKLTRTGETEGHGQSLGHLRSAEGISLKYARHADDAGLLLLKLGLAFLHGRLDRGGEVIIDAGDLE